MRVRIPIVVEPGHPSSVNQDAPGEASYPSSATVRRLRPLARRRLSTIRPFFVDILTRNPCVFARRRVFGWNVRFPFFDLAMLFLTSRPGQTAGQTEVVAAGDRRRNFQY